MAKAAESDRSDDNEIDLGELFTQLLARKWTLLWALLIGLFLGGLYGQLAPNEWRSAALVQIEERSSGVQLPTELIGDLMGSLGEPASSFATETHVIRSGLILDPVVTDLGLTTRVSPIALPVVGDMLNRLDLYGRVPALDALLPARYPRPGETVTVAELTLAEPFLGAPFALEVLGEARFAVTWQGETLTGRVGAPLALGAAGTLVMASLDAAPGRVFEIRALPVRSARRQVANSLSISERGSRTGTGIVDFAMTRGEPEAAQEILATVIETYQRANVRRRSAELDQSIDFIESQLPEVRGELERAIDRLAAFRGQQDAQELSLGTQQIVEQSVELEARLQQLDFQIEDLLERVTPNHPDYRALVAERERVSQRFVLDHSRDLSGGDGADHGQRTALALIDMGLRRSLACPAPSTLDRRIASWRAFHRMRNLQSPFDAPGVRQARAKGRRANARIPAPKSANPITRDVVEEILRASEPGTRGLRDMAIILTGWASGGRRRSELAALMRADVDLSGFDEGGVIRLSLVSTKTTPRGATPRLVLKGRAARMLVAWIDHAGIADGPLFRAISKSNRVLERGLSPAGIGLIVRNRLRAAGFPENFASAHGLRSGFLTQAALDGAPIQAAMRLSLHRSMAQALAYFDDVDIASNPAADLLD